jgi:hypothetical protein
MICRWPDSNGETWWSLSLQGVPHKPVSLEEPHYLKFLSKRDQYFIDDPASIVWNFEGAFCAYSLLRAAKGIFMACDLGAPLF